MKNILLIIFLLTSCKAKTQSLMFCFEPFESSVGTHQIKSQKMFRMVNGDSVLQREMHYNKFQKIEKIIIYKDSNQIVDYQLDFHYINDTVIRTCSEIAYSPRSKKFLIMKLLSMYKDKLIEAADTSIEDVRHFETRYEFDGNHILAKLFYGHILLDSLPGRRGTINDTSEIKYIHDSSTDLLIKQRTMAGQKTLMYLTATDSLIYMKKEFAHREGKYTLADYVMYAYDNDKKLIEAIQCNSLGILSHHLSYEYKTQDTLVITDKNYTVFVGQPETLKSVYKNNTIVYEELYVVYPHQTKEINLYNRKGDIIEFRKENPDGDLMWRYVYQYEYYNQ